MALTARSPIASTIGPASCAASTTSTSWSSPTSQMLFSTSKSSPSIENTPLVVTCSMRAVTSRCSRLGCSHHHHGAQHLTALHLVERVLDAVERNRLRDEAVEVEATLEVEVDERGEVALGQAVAVP